MSEITGSPTIGVTLSAAEITVSTPVTPASLNPYIQLFLNNDAALDAHMTRLDAALTHMEAAVSKLERQANSVVTTTITAKVSTVNPLNYTFTVTASSSEGVITERLVEFGDGQQQTLTAGQTSLAHTYATAGSYLARVTAKDDLGATASNVVQVTPSQPVVTASLDGVPVVGSPNKYSFSPNYSTAGIVTSATLDFGDGSALMDITKPGPYIHEYAASSTLKTYTVTMTVTQSNGPTKTVTMQVSVGATVGIITADLQAVAGDPGLVVGGTYYITPTFSTSYGRITEATLDFGDGSPTQNVTSGSGKTVNHVYALSGTDKTYTINLTVFQTDGATKSVTRMVTVAAHALAPLPKPTLSAGPMPLGQPTDYLISGGYDESNPLDPSLTVKLNLYFGNGDMYPVPDGKTYISPAIYKDYGQPGTYTVRLVATDQHGRTAEATFPIEIAEAATTYSLLAAGTPEANLRQLHPFDLLQETNGTSTTTSLMNFDPGMTTAEVQSYAGTAGSLKNAILEKAGAILFSVAAAAGNGDAYAALKYVWDDVAPTKLDLSGYAFTAYQNLVKLYFVTDPSVTPDFINQTMSKGIAPGSIPEIAMVSTTHYVLKFNGEFDATVDVPAGVKAVYVVAASHWGVDGAPYSTAVALTKLRAY